MLNSMRPRDRLCRVLRTSAGALAVLGSVLVSAPTAAADDAPRAGVAPQSCRGGVSGGLVLWLDASDPAGDDSVPEPGDAVVQWADKSGAGNHVLIDPRPVVRLICVVGAIVRNDEDFIGKHVSLRLSRPRVCVAKILV